MVFFVVYLDHQISAAHFGIKLVRQNVVYLDYQISAVYFDIKLIKQIFASEIMFFTSKNVKKPSDSQLFTGKTYF